MEKGLSVPMYRRLIWRAIHNLRRAYREIPEIADPGNRRTVLKGEMEAEDILVGRGRSWQNDPNIGHSRSYEGMRALIIIYTRG